MPQIDHNLPHHRNLPLHNTRLVPSLDWFREDERELALQNNHRILSHSRTPTHIWWSPPGPFSTLSPTRQGNRQITPPGQQQLGQSFYLHSQRLLPTSAMGRPQDGSLGTADKSHHHHLSFYSTNPVPERNSSQNSSLQKQPATEHETLWKPTLGMSTVWTATTVQDHRHRGRTRREKQRTWN